MPDAAAVIFGIAGGAGEAATAVAPEVATDVAAAAGPAAAGAGEAAAAVTAPELVGGTAATAAGDVAALEGPLVGGTATTADLAAPPTAAGAATFSGSALPSAAGTAGTVASPTELLSGSTGATAALDTSNAGSPFSDAWNQNIVAPINQAGGVGSLATGINQPGEAFGTSAFAPSDIPQQTAALPPGIMSPGGEAVPFTEAGTGTSVTPAAANALDTGALAQPGATVSTTTTGGPSVGAPTDLNAPTASTSGVASLLSSQNLKTLALAAPLGVLGYDVLRGEPSLPPAAEQAVNQLGPTEQLANQYLGYAEQNEVTPAQAAQIQQYIQSATDALYQQYAAMGVDPNSDSGYISGVAQINQNALAMQANFIQTMVSDAISAEGAVSNTLMAAAQIQVAQDTAFQQSITSAVTALGTVAAISAITTKA